MPLSVVTLTITASRFTARPMPSVTLFFGSTGKEVGYALMSTMRRLLGPAVDAAMSFSFYFRTLRLT